MRPLYTVTPRLVASGTVVLHGGPIGYRPSFTLYIVWCIYSVYLSASAAVIHCEEALYQVYGPLPFTFFISRIGHVLRHDGHLKAELEVNQQEGGEEIKCYMFGKLWWICCTEMGN